MPSKLQDMQGQQFMHNMQCGFLQLDQRRFCALFCMFIGLQGMHIFNCMSDLRSWILAERRSMHSLQRKLPDMHTVILHNVRHNINFNFRSVPLMHRLIKRRFSRVYRVHHNIKQDFLHKDKPIILPEQRQVNCMFINFCQLALLQLNHSNTMPKRLQPNIKQSVPFAKQSMCGEYQVM
jgi:hypothetical protein